MDIDKFLNKKEDEAIMTSIANKYAIEISDPIIKKLGSGNFGFAYQTKSNKVIKVSKDPSEVYTAHKISKKSLKNVANIYDISFEDDVHAIVLQDLLTISDSIKEDFLNLEKKLNEVQMYMSDFLESELEDNDLILSEKELKMARDISNGVNEVFDNGGFAYDVHEDNVGINESGNYVIFDQKDIHSDPLIYKNKIKEIKNQPPKSKIKLKR